MDAQRFLDAPKLMLEQLHLVIANGEGKSELVEVLIELGHWCCPAMTLLE
jgi:hypothetical protein